MTCSYPAFLLTPPISSQPEQTGQDGLPRNNYGVPAIHHYHFPEETSSCCQLRPPISVWYAPRCLTQRAGIPHHRSVDIFILEGISLEAPLRGVMIKESTRLQRIQWEALQARFIVFSPGRKQRFICRHCATSSQEDGWKRANDALQHLNRHHFELDVQCATW